MPGRRQRLAAEPLAGTVGGSGRKDELERRMCRAVCDGQLTLPAAQAIFLGDWRAEFR
jgi:hypothetical protein